MSPSGTSPSGGSGRAVACRACVCGCATLPGRPRHVLGRLGTALWLPEPVMRGSREIAHGALPLLAARIRRLTLMFLRMPGQVAAMTRGGRSVTRGLALLAPDRDERGLSAGLALLSPQTHLQPRGPERTART